MPFRTSPKRKQSIASGSSLRLFFAGSFASSEGQNHSMVNARAGLPWNSQHAAKIGTSYWARSRSRQMIPVWKSECRLLRGLTPARSKTGNSAAPRPRSAWMIYHRKLPFAIRSNTYTSFVFCV
jgi:hypothetical protein